MALFIPSVTFKKELPIVGPTVASCNMLFLTQKTFTVFCMVLSSVVGAISYLQVLNSVVVFNMIDVVHNFVRKQITSYVRFNYQSVLPNITKTIRVGMLRTINKNVSSPIISFPISKIMKFSFPFPLFERSFAIFLSDFLSANIFTFHYLGLYHERGKA